MASSGSCPHPVADRRSLSMRRPWNSPRPMVTAQMIDRMDDIDGDPDLEDLREDWEDPHDREDVYD